MLELLAYLRANGFKTFIVSGGGVEFMRPWTEKAYGIPPEQVVGSSGKTEVSSCATATPVLIKLPRSSSSTTVRASRSASTASSAAARSSPSATPTATCRCCNGRRRTADARFAPASSITPTPSANTPTTGSRTVGKLDKALDEAPQARLDRRRHEERLEDDLQTLTLTKACNGRTATTFGLLCLSFRGVGDERQGSTRRAPEPGRESEHQPARHPAVGNGRRAGVDFQRRSDGAGPAGPANACSILPGRPEAQHPGDHGRRHRLVQSEHLQPRHDGLPDAEHRPHRQRGRAVHRLVRRAELHRRPRGVHHRAVADPHRTDQGRPARRRSSACSPRTRASPNC